MEANIPSCNVVKQNGCKKYTPTETPFELEMLQDKLITIDWSKIRMPHKSDLTDLLMKRILSNMSPDCTVIIGDDVFQCQLMVLKCYSKYFDSTEGNQFIFDPKKVSARAFSFIYNWMIESGPNNYTSLSKQNILEICLASHILGIKELENQCETFIGCDEMRTEEAAVLMYLRASQLGDKYITFAFECNVLTYFFTLVSSHNFLKLPPGVLCDLLNSNYITVNSEFEVFMSAVRWLMHDWDERKQFLVDVMQCIRFGHIAPWQLVDILRNPQNPEFLLVSSNCEVQKMIEEGIRHATIKHGCGNKSQDLHNILCLESPSPRNWIDMGKSYNSYQDFLADLELHRRHHNNPLLEPTFAKKFCRMNELLPLKKDLLSLQSYSTDISSIVSNDKYTIQAHSTTKSQTSSLSGEYPNPYTLFQKPQRIRFSDDQYQERRHTEMSETSTSSSYDESINPIPSETFGINQEHQIEQVASFTFDINAHSSSSKGEQPIRDQTLKSFDVYFLPEVGGPFRNPLSSVEKFDPASGIWQEVAPMSKGRTGLAATKYKDRIWVAGGITGLKKSNNRRVTGSVECYDPKLNTWIPGKYLQFPMCFGQLFAKYDTLYVIGGAGRKSERDQNTASIGSIHAWNEEKQEWSLRTDLAIPRHNHSVSYLATQMLIIGGVTTIYMKALRNIECYCCDRRTWIRGIAELPINVTGHDSLTLPAANMMNST